MALDFLGAAGAVGRFIAVGWVETELAIGKEGTLLGKRRVEARSRGKRMWPAPQRAGHTTQLITTNGNGENADRRGWKRDCDQAPGLRDEVPGADGRNAGSRNGGHALNTRAAGESYRELVMNGSTHRMSGPGDPIPNDPGKPTASTVPQARRAPEESYAVRRARRPRPCINRKKACSNTERRRARRSAPPVRPSAISADSTSRRNADVSGAPPYRSQI